VCATLIIIQSDSNPEPRLTEHFADIRLDVNILQVLMGVGVVQSQSRVQANRNPNSVPEPCQLSHLAFFPGMNIKGFLQGTNLNYIHDFNSLNLTSTTIVRGSTTWILFL